ncbi:MAG: winged helix family two component transcriptional regulator [Candidatus Berkelbacteria bacterium]|nr:winged helix family two component transcriptional regulator [Candidatus Berkelbacteria bacterium]
MAKKILIVEDEKPIANALFNKLKSEGFEPKMVINGQEALDILAQEKFDLILLDLMMPIVNGFEVLKKMKDLNNTAPVIVLSNLGQEEDVQKAMEMGAKNFFVKADTPLIEVINQINHALELV